MKANFYIGLRAIGWLVTDKNNVVANGIKRVHVPFDHYYEFLAGLPVSAMVNRRMKRQARRNRWRRQSRRENLKCLLEENGYHLSKKYSRNEMLKLRVKALTEKLSKVEIANVLMALQKKRGYKSLRGVSDNENSDYLQTIAEHEENRKQYKSIADYLLTLDSSKNVIFNRESYEEEFNLIADAQNFNEKFRKKVFGYIYYQRPLRKGKVAKCKYEPNKSVMHASNPKFQLFRIYRDVNNIKIWDLDENELEIPKHLRGVWVEGLMKGQKLTKAKVCKDLGLKKSSQYRWLSGKFIAPYPYALFKELFPLAVDDSILWQELYSAVDEVKLKSFLAKKYNFDEYTIDQLCDIDMQKMGWSDISLKAAQNLFPLLLEDKKLKTAILEKYGKVDFTQVELRNWILEKHFYAYKSLVERIQKDYPISSIQFEIDYSLKAGNKQRKTTAKNKRAKTKRAKQNPNFNSHQLLKLKLWEESNGFSPYVADYEIPKKELLSKKWSIDHIVPKSKLYESGYANMVLCPTNLNQEKGNNYTGIEFAEKIGVAEWYKTKANEFKGLKKTYLLMRMDEIPRDEISKRQNSDYNTKCFATIGNATNIPNKLITRYIKQWKLNQYDENDCRYYLAKAFVLANFNQETVNYFDNIQDIESNPYGLEMDLPMIDIANAPIFLQRIKFTRKSKYGFTPRFNLHKETVYGERKEITRNAKRKEVINKYYKVRQPISSLTKPMVGKITDEVIKAKIEKRTQEKGSHEEMLLSLIDEPIRMNKKPVKAVSVRTNAKYIYPLHSADDKGNVGAKNKYERPVSFVFSAVNYALHIREENGKMKRETLPLLAFVDGINQGLDIRGTKVLQANDLVELDGRLYFLIGASEAPTLRPIYTLSATDNYNLKVADYQRLYKVEVNQLGEVKRKFKVWQSPE